MALWQFNDVYRFEFTLRIETNETNVFLYIFGYAIRMRSLGYNYELFAIAAAMMRNHKLYLL